MFRADRTGGQTRVMTLFVDVLLPALAVPAGGVLAVDGDVTVELEQVVPTDRATQYLWLVGGGYERVREALRTESGVESLATLDEYADRALVRVHWQRLDTPFLDLLEEFDVVLVGAEGSADGWEATLRFPDEAALGTFLEASGRRRLGVELRAINGARLKDRSDDVLSSVQRETLEAAFEAGYFDVPRTVTVADLADRLDRSEQAVSEALRRAISNYLTATIHSPAREEGSTEDS